MPAQFVEHFEKSRGGRNGWHPGEAVIQRKFGFGGHTTDLWHEYTSYLQDRHRLMLSQMLYCIPICTLDDELRPWGSLLTGRGGEIGYTSSPDERTLHIDAHSWDGDPFVSTVAAWEREPAEKRDPYRYLMSGLGMDFITRRRVKFAGRVVDASRTGDHELHLDLRVESAIGNCPKYINIREIEPYSNAKPRVEQRVMHMDEDDELPQEIIDFIHASDTVFMSSIYKAKPEDAAKFPSHAGLNHRGGLPGFVRVSRRRTVVVPEYSGNRHLSSLGNIETSGLAGLTVFSFETGDILYLTGVGEVLVGEPALKLMPRQPGVTTIRATGYVLVRDALPLRLRGGAHAASPVPSPYTPPVKYLREENRDTLFDDDAQPQARLVRVDIHTDDVATLAFELDPTGTPIKIRPGQAIALDFSRFVPKAEYAHMRNDAPTSLNDDRVRTWTVSSAHETGEARSFALTMREKPGGAVTGELFALARSLRDRRPELLHDTRPVALDVGVVGVAGDFFLPAPSPDDGAVRVLCLAGGIGITPFMSMLQALVARGPATIADVRLVVATREPVLFAELIRISMGPDPPRGVRVRCDMFTQAEVPPDLDFGLGVEADVRRERIPNEYWAQLADGRETFICGPNRFGDAAVAGLRDAGMPTEKVHREGFLY